MEKESFVLDPEDWDYLYEGNEHLILKYTGANTNFVGKVLRLKKILKKKEKDSNLKRKWSDNILEEEIMKLLIAENVFESHPILKEHFKTVIFSFGTYFRK